MLKVECSLIDGGSLDWTVGDEVFHKLKRLRRDGYEGKELVHELLTDDSGAPPVVIQISGTLEDGTRVNESIRYN